MLSKIDKVYREGDRVYLQPGEEPPPGVGVEKGPRGGRFFRGRASSGHGGWERRRRITRRATRLAQAEEPQAGDVVRTATGQVRVREMLPSGGAMVDTDRGPARIGPEALADSVKRSQIYQLVEDGTLPSSFDEMSELLAESSAQFKKLMDAVYSTPGYRVRTEATRQFRGNISMSATIVADDGRIVGNLSREFGADTEVYHSVFVLQQAEQGGALAARMNRQAELAYTAMGFTRINLSADIDIGKYAWARQGYDFSSRVAQLEKIPDQLRSFLEDNGMDPASADAYAKEVSSRVQHSWDLAALDDGKLYYLGDKGSFALGKAFMLSNRWPSWHGTKDIRPGSLSKLVGDAYLYASDQRPGKKAIAAAQAKRQPFILPYEYADLGGDDSAHWDTDERTDASWRRRLGRINAK